MLGVVAALPTEARCLLGRNPKPGMLIPLAGTGWVQLAGMGPHNARRAAESLLAAGATGLLSWGVAAGLAPQLQSGALLLPANVLAADEESFATDPAWRARVLASIEACIESNTQNLAETPTALTTPSEKSALRQRFAAVAADMESAAIAAVAKKAGVPFLAIRAVVDAHSVSLPPAAMAAFDMQGRLHVLRLFKALARQPQQIAGLLALARGMHAASRSLSRLVRLTGPSLGFETKI